MKKGGTRCQGRSKTREDCRVRSAALGPALCRPAPPHEPTAVKNVLAARVQSPRMKLSGHTTAKLPHRWSNQNRVNLESISSFESRSRGGLARAHLAGFHVASRLLCPYCREETRAKCPGCLAPRSRKGFRTRLLERGLESYVKTKVDNGGPL